jgi:hypothetical protein
MRVDAKTLVGLFGFLKNTRLVTTNFIIIKFIDSRHKLY